MMKYSEITKDLSNYLLTKIRVTVKSAKNWIQKLIKIALKISQSVKNDDKTQQKS